MDNLDRRRLLKGSAAAAVVATIALPATEAAALEISPDLAAVIARYQQAAVVSDTWHGEVFDPADDAYREALKAIPHHTTRSTWVTKDGHHRPLSTTAKVDVEIVEDYRRQGWTFSDTDFGRCLAELADAIDNREVRRQRLSIKHRMKELVEESNRLTGARWDALAEVQQFPVRTAFDLLTKLELASTEADDDELSAELVIGDLKRIVGRV